MSSNGTKRFEWEVSRTYCLQEYFTASELPFPPWLEKRLEALKLIKTDWKAGLALLNDSLQDEDDVLEKAYFSRFPDRNQAEEDWNA